jgi:hypothetical protein
MTVYGVKETLIFVQLLRFKITNKQQLKQKLLTIKQGREHYELV